jgi:hypothetical protein
MHVLGSRCLRNPRELTVYGTIAATMDVYATVAAQLLPTPAKVPCLELSVLHLLILSTS